MSQEKMDAPLQEAVRRAGGFRPLARKLGIKYGALYTWRRAPPLRVIEIERLTGVSRHDLRPDIYPKES